jgi:hypothetical protein
MSVAAEVRQRSLDKLRRHLWLTGVDQIDPADAADGRWKRYARCGPWNDDAPDPDLFFPLRSDDDRPQADSLQTYQAQAYCQSCPVREYCDRAASADPKNHPGMWGGILRNDRGEVMVLCDSLRCFRYRIHGQQYCRNCLTRQEAEKAAAAAAARQQAEAAREKRRADREQERRDRAAAKAARRAAKTRPGVTARRQADAAAVASLGEAVAVG